MSTPIQSNSEGLQRILQTVNSLPDAGSGGATFQRKAESFTAQVDPNDNTILIATVNCGFKPDVVILKGTGYSDGVNTAYYDRVAVFTERSADKTYYVAGCDNTCAVWDGSIEQTENGFSINIWGYDDDWQSVTLTSKTIDYVAIKYT